MKIVQSDEVLWLASGVPGSAASDVARARVYACWCCQAEAHQCSHHCGDQSCFACREFREDLFHRLAFAVLLLPPLREREGDLGLLTDSMLVAINAEASSRPGYKHKELDASARNVLFGHPWPGNVRELHNTLLRASIWASGDKITGEDVAASLVVTVLPKGDSVLGRSLEQGISLPDLMAAVAHHYLERAMAQAHGNKSEASRLLGLGSYQILSNWLQKYGVR